MKKSHFRQYMAAFVVSLCAYSAGCSFVWVTPILPRLMRKDAQFHVTTTEASWIVSLIDIGNLFTLIPSTYFSDKLGRRPVLLSTAPMYILTWIIVLATRSVIGLYVMRTVQGMALCTVCIVLPMYLSEIAEPALRGSVSVFFFGMWFLGILSVYCIGPYISYQNLTWYCLLPPILFGGTFWYLPESPHFLISTNQERRASDSLIWLRGKRNASEIYTELRSMMDTVKEETSTKGAWRDLILTRKGRKSLLIVQIVAMTHIMSGISPILSYATSTLIDSNVDLIDPNICTIIIGFIMMFVTLLSGSFVDKIGRRLILLISSLGTALTLTFTAIFFYLLQKTNIDLSDFKWVLYGSIFSYVAVLNFGLSTLNPLLQAELFPTTTRGVASCITVLNISVMSFIVLNIYLPIEDSSGIYLNYVIYAGFAMFGSLLIYWLLPETKGKSFQEIQNSL